MPLTAIKSPKTSFLVRLLSVLVALAIAAGIVHLVFTFGYFASGLAVLDADERRRQETPIPLEFNDPNAP